MRPTWLGTRPANYVSIGFDGTSFIDAGAIEPQYSLIDDIAGAGIMRMGLESIPTSGTAIDLAKLDLYPAWQTNAVTFGANWPTIWSIIEAAGEPYNECIATLYSPLGISDAEAVSRCRSLLGRGFILGAHDTINIPYGMNMIDIVLEAMS